MRGGTMYCQPHGRRLSLRCLDAMAHVRGDLNPIAGLHVDGDVTLFEAKAGSPRQQHDELVVGLVVPEARRPRLPGRDDAFDAHAGTLDEKVDLRRPGVEKFKALAESARMPLSQLALNWIAKNQAVTSMIVGASRPEQVEENVSQFGVKLPEEVTASLDAVATPPAS